MSENTENVNEPRDKFVVKSRGSNKEILDDSLLSKYRERGSSASYSDSDIWDRRLTDETKSLNRTKGQENLNIAFPVPSPFDKYITQIDTKKFSGQKIPGLETPTTSKEGNPSQFKIRKTLLRNLQFEPENSEGLKSMVLKGSSTSTPSDVSQKSGDTSDETDKEDSSTKTDTTIIGKINSSEPPTDSIETPKISTQQELLEQFKDQLTPFVKKEHVDTFFEDRKNIELLNQTIQKESSLDKVVNFFKNRLTLFSSKSEEETPTGYFTPTGRIGLPTIKSDLSFQNSGFKAPNSFKKERNRQSVDRTSSFITSKQETNMTSQIKGISLKDALDLIPRFNGNNIPLAQFIDGCNEAKEILPEGVESELTRLIRMRLYGDALSCSKGHVFETIDDIANYFEKIFGSLKTYHDLLGEFGKTKQKPSESVVVYANRLRAIIEQLRKVAIREKRNSATSFEADLENDAVKIFTRGLRWEIKVRMNKPPSFDSAVEDAIEIERDFACTVMDDDSININSRFRPRDIRRVNIVESADTITCQFCNKVGHGALNCIQLAYKIGNNSNNNFNSTRGNNFQREGWRGNTNRTRDGIPSREWRDSISSNRPPNVGNVNGSFPANAVNTRYRYNSNPQERFSSNNEGNNQNRRPNDRISYRDPTEPNMNRPTFSGRPINGEPGGNTPLSCYHCGKAGHIKRNCYKWQREMQSQNNPAGNGAGLPQAGAGEGNSTTRPVSNSDREKFPLSQ